jgi:hypothetical protein
MTVRLIDLLDSFFAYWLGPQSLIIFVIALIVSLHLLRRKQLLVRIIASLLFSAWAYFLVYGGIFAWLLRDGIGLGSVRSYGRTAIVYWLQDYIFIVLYSLIPFGLGTVVCLISRKRSPQN